MPLFRRGKKAEKEEKQIVASIKEVPRHEEAISFLSDWIEVEYEIIRTPLPYDVYGDVLVEAAMDKTRVSVLFPSSINARANFQNYLKLKLNSLDAGFSPDGVAIVGLRKTIINRKYPDGYVSCMEDVYGISWKTIQSLVNKTKAFPILLIGNQLTFCVAPIKFETSPLEMAWEKGKYNPKSKMPVSIVRKMDISLDLNRLISQVKDGGIVVIYSCPNCGGKLKIGKDTSAESLNVCEYCGTKIEAMELADFLRTALS